MTTKEKYDDIIDYIELLVSEGVGAKALTIADSVIRDKGMWQPMRDLSAVMNFMTGKSLIHYIKSRQLMRAYEYILESDADNYDANIAIEFTDLGDQSAFIKSFKKQFGITPGIAQKEKDYSLAIPPSSWSTISGNETGGNITDEQEDKKPVMNAQMFGIDKAKLGKITEALDLQSIYGFNDIQSEAAFALTEKYCGISMREAYGFIDDLTIQRFDDIDNVTSEEWEDFASNIDFSYPLIYTYFNLDLSVSQAYELIWELKRQGVEDISEVDFEVVVEYNKYSLSYRNVKELKSYYDSNKNESCGGFDDFMGSVTSGYSPEIAFELIDYGSYEQTSQQYDPELIKKSYEEDMIDNRWIEVETDYANMERFDKEPDLDNLAYEDDDFGELDFSYDDYDEET